MSLENLSRSNQGDDDDNDAIVDNEEFFIYAVGDDDVGAGDG